MGIVSNMVDVAQGQLDAVAAGVFGNIVGAAGTTISAMATLAIVLLGVNLVLQYRPMGAGQVVVTVIKLLVIVFVGLRWGQFSSIASAVERGMDGIAGSMLASFNGAGGGNISGSLAGAVDRLLTSVSEAANSALEPLGWMAGAVMSTLIAFMIAVVSALVSFLLIFAKVMVTVFLSIAPIYIALSMFEVTKDYFNRWLQQTISYMVYPVVIAAVIGGVIRLVAEFMRSLSTTDAGASIAGFIPFLMALFIMGAVTVLIPSIVSGITGNFILAGPVGSMVGAGKMASQGLSAAGATAGAAGGLVKAGVGGNAVGLSNLASKLAARSRKF